MRLWLCYLLPAMLLAGCDSGTRQLARESLLYCVEGAPLTFNPQLVTSTVTLDATAHQLYDRLLDLDPNNQQPVPALAINWQRSEDGLRYRFTLRPGVSFHHTDWFSPGRPLTAEDVVFTFKRLTDPDHPYHPVSGGRYPFFDSIGWAELIREVRAFGDNEVEFILSRPDASFLANLATDYAVILSAEYGRQLLDQGSPQLLDQQPVGTGPFKLAQYRTDEFIRYHRHPEYWRGSARLNQLIFDITPKSSKRLAKLLTGECDVMAYPGASQLSVITRHSGLELAQATGMSVSVLALNTEKPPFNDIRVRKAIGLALSREDILHAVYFDIGSLAESLLPPVSWGYHPNLLAPLPDIDRARWLLEQAGVAEGFAMTLLVPAGASTFNPDGLKTGQLIQRQLSELGIRVRLLSLEEQVLRRDLREGGQDAVLTGWSADTPDPDHLLRNLLGCQAVATGTNTSRWCHPLFERQLEQALAAPSLAERIRHYHLAQELAYQDLPLIPLIHSLKLQAYRSQVKGLRLPPFGGVAFHQAYKE
ncbi:ABC transporter substrate-binding protein [Zobellella endophytica]|uniref:ABC transporter substrate-binding protein n=1 Tax=Zobellella endophytica TaxID=2116700 RepID=A0A2P7RAX9_9GAMM|nr:ABC transporter substrate-binding protein [Zobellella endophytica]PSJ47330.1 ABC transporter substrate-binding protein [Zobellella endophytica]